MERELKVLVEANLPQNRTRWITKWKEETGDVVGYIGPNVPEEVIYAAKMLPVAAAGTWEAATPNASVHRPWMTCVYCTHVLEAVLNGELDYLNAVVITSHDDDFKRLWDVIKYVNKPRNNYLMYLPHINNKATLEAWKKSIFELKKNLEVMGNCFVRDEALVKAIEVFSTTRRLLHRIYDMRKRETPPLTGAEYLGLVTASRIMPKDEFNRRLEALMPYIETRKAQFKKLAPRVLVSGDFLEHPGYLEIIENAGCVVAMDDLEAGSRYFWEEIDTSIADPWEALAQRYLKVASPRMVNWEEQFDQLMGWVKEFNVQGVVELRQLYAFPREFRFSYGVKRLEEAGIPHLFLRSEYHLSGAGMMATRVEAFAEMLESKVLA